jgi:hypothetical protein
VLVAESVPARVRGKLVTIGTNCNVMAFALAGWINYALYGRDSRSAAIIWRFPLAFPLAFLIFILPALWLCTESPRWLLLVGRDDEARHVLARLAGKPVSDDGTVDDAEVTEQLRLIRGAIREEREDQVDLWSVLACRDKTQNLRRLVLSCFSQLMQQTSGINVAGFFMPVMFAAMGKTQAESLLMSAAVSTFYVVSIVTSLLLIDRLGRRM